MRPQTFIVIGRSGSGKGTQVELLQKYMRENDPDGDHFHLYTGNEFRAFIQGEGYSSERSRELMDEGGLQPAFLAVLMWSQKFIKEYSGQKHIFIDGSPRTYPESLTLHSAFEFYKREKPTVIHVKVSKEEAVERLMSRGRDDDNREAIEKRVSWFDTTVLPAIEYYIGREDYHYVEVDGEQSIEGVHESIIEQISTQ